MPPSPKLTKEEILLAMERITRREGYEAVNARSIGKELGTSPSPIFTWFPTMQDAYQAFRLYEQARFDAFLRPFTQDDALGTGLGYVAYAREEPKLFRFLMAGSTPGLRTEPGLRMEGERLIPDEAFARENHLPQGESGEGQLHLWIYAYGLAMLSSTNDIRLSPEQVQGLLQHVRQQLQGSTTIKESNHHVG